MFIPPCTLQNSLVGDHPKVLVKGLFLPGAGFPPLVILHPHNRDTVPSHLLAILVFWRHPFFTAGFMNKPTNSLWQSWGNLWFHPSLFLLFLQNRRADGVYKGKFVSVTPLQLLERHNRSSALYTHIRPSCIPASS